MQQFDHKRVTVDVAVITSAATAAAVVQRWLIFSTSTVAALVYFHLILSTKSTQYVHRATHGGRGGTRGLQKQVRNLLGENAHRLVTYLPTTTHPSVHPNSLPRDPYGQETNEYLYSYLKRKREKKFKNGGRKRSEK